MMDQQIVGAVELGGTKTVIALGTGAGTILHRATIPTGHPDQVVRAIRDFFDAHPPAPSALGIGAFGPVVIDPAAPDFGRIIETNKPGWSGFDLHRAFVAATGLPVAMATDVGAAGIAEARQGALRDVALGLYLTVGTGIGGAILCHGEILPALLHPEMGHVRIGRAPGDDMASTCRFHDDCAEGLAAGPAIARRFGASLSHFQPGGPEYRLVAGYLGECLAAAVLMISPQRIVVGGGVGKAEGLVAAVRDAMLDRLGPYGARAAADDGFVVPPALGQDAGITGALMLAAPHAVPAMEQRRNGAANERPVT